MYSQFVKIVIKKGKRSYRKSGIQSQTSEHAQNSKTKANVIIKWTNTRTRTTEPMEHWLSKWIKDDVLETYNTVRSTISKTQPITTSDQYAIC